MKPRSSRIFTRPRPCELPDTGADLIILAGDIHRPAQALQWPGAGAAGDHVAGNHEYYGSSIAATDRLLRESSRDSLVTVLDCGEKRIGTVRILGATLWSDFRIVGDGPAREQAMEQATAFSRDFSRITVDERAGKCSPAPLRDAFEQHARWLESRLAEPFDGETVVVTHFAPSAGSIARVSPVRRSMPASSPISSRWSNAAARRCGYTVTPTTASTTPRQNARAGQSRGYVREGVAENAAFDPG